MQNSQPTYKTFNLLTRLATYLQDFQLTYMTYSTYTQGLQRAHQTFILPTSHKYDRKLDFQPTDKALSQLTRLRTNLQDTKRI